MIKLASVYETANADDTAGLLFHWLGQRTPEQSISHKAMPPWSQHVAFVRSMPYAAWYLIYTEDENGIRAIGNIYLTHKREVGIHIDAAERGRHAGEEALAQFRALHPGPLLANINPANEGSVAFFVKHGAKLIQHTYEL